MNMLINYYRNTTLTALVMVTAITFSVSSNAALVNYSQNFEGLNRADASALGDDGWLVFANVFDTDKTSYLYDYGVYAAPNGGAGFSSVATGNGGIAQGAQQLTVFSDYNNTDQATGNWIDALVYQEQTITAADAGATMSFVFDAKQGYISGESTAEAFIRTLDSGDGFALTNNVLLNTTSLSSTWDSYTLNLLIPADNSLDGQLLQFGFSSFAANYQGSDNFYDNINTSITSAPASSAVPVPAAVWLFMSGFAALLGQAGFARRKKSGLMSFEDKLL